MQSVIRTTCRVANVLKTVSGPSRCSCISSSHSLSWHRKSSTEAMAPPHAEGTDKAYAPKIQKIVEDISQLTLIEVADLNELLKKTLNIADAPVMAMGAMPASAQAPQEEEEEVKVEKSLFSVKLTKFEDGKKVALIKEIKGLVSGLNLVQAKKFVESVPQIVRQDIPKDEAEQLKEALAKVGATVEIE